jgi:pimeloyl-ACP methyl ester carboxylesterase
MRKMGSVPIFLALVVLGVPLLMFLFQDRLLFFPQPLSDAQRAQLGEKEILLDAGGVRLQAWHIPGEPLVLYFGGNAEEVSWMLREARRHVPGAGWLLVSYRGYGGSEGSPSAKNISEDALRWHDHARDELKAKKVFVFGRSLGSGAAVHVAANRPVAGAILVTPFDSLTAVAGHHYPWLPVDWMLRHRFDSSEAAPKIAAPLLCIAAGRDEVIPPAHAKRLYGAWAGPKRWMLLEGAGHNSTDGMPGFWQAITDFLKPNP